MLSSYRHSVVEEGFGGLLQQLRELSLAQVVIYGVLYGILVVDVDGTLQGELQVGFHLARKGQAARHLNPIRGEGLPSPPGAPARLWLPGTVGLIPWHFQQHEA